LSADALKALEETKTAVKPDEKPKEKEPVETKP